MSPIADPHAHQRAEIRELLIMLMEEAAEVQMAVSKLLRHGPGSTHPDGGPHNLDQLTEETGDMRAVIGLLSIVWPDYALRIAGDTTLPDLERMRSKLRYTHHQRLVGIELVLRDVEERHRANLLQRVNLLRAESPR